jgi:hypothetical protein
MKIVSARSLIRMAVAVTLLAAALALPERGHAADATPQDAKALVKDAIAHWDDVGRDQAMSDFNSGEAPWIDPPLYVIVYDEDGVFYTHVNPGLRGVNLWDLQDINGKYIIRHMVRTAVENDKGGWTNYVWQNPANEKQEQKWTWCEQHDGMLFAVGAYGQDPTK